MADKKKLLFVITQGVAGGATRNVFDLANSFKDSYYVSVAMGGDSGSNLFKKLVGENPAPFQGKDPYTSKRCGIKTHHLKFLGRDINIFDDILAFFEILRLYKKEKPDLIHLHSSKVGLFGSIAGFIYKLGVKYKPKIIFTAHGWVFKEDLSRLKRLAFIFLARLAALFQDKIICVSQDDFNQALQNKIAPAKKLFTIHNAVSPDKFLTKEKARIEISKMINKELPHDAFLITNLGRLYANKGLNYLIEAVKEVKNKLQASSFKFHDLRLVIFGDGPERKSLESRIMNYELRENVFLTGDVADVSQYLKAFDAMVLSSVKEGFPYAILEAGLAGVPFIATNVGGVGEAIKNNETGILIEPKNVEALVSAILKVYSDKEFSQKISANLKKAIYKDFSFENLIEKTDWVYKA